MKLDNTITIAAVATFVSALTSAIVSLSIARSNKIKSLDDQLAGILKIAIQFPYLESPDFTSSWKFDENKDDEKYLRYNAYTILLFNFLSDVAEHFAYKQEDIEQYIALKYWVKLHGKIWFAPQSREDIKISYQSEFITLIDHCLPPEVVDGIKKMT